MLIKGLVDEDLLQYKKPSMFIIMPKCSFKCDREFGSKICQNSSLAQAQTLEVKNEDIINRYLNNPITSAIVFGGLEPFESWDDLSKFIKEFRKVSDDDIVIYTGFNKDEISANILLLKKFKNIIVKFGRYIPNQKSHYDNVLKINLASDNQYGEIIS